MSNEIFSFELNTPYDEELSYLTIVSESESGTEQRYQKWLKAKRTFPSQIKLSRRDGDRPDMAFLYAP